MTGKKLLRSTNDKWVAGILGGIAEYLDWDPAILPLAYVLLTIFSAAFPGLLMYIFLWIVMPKQ